MKKLKLYAKRERVIKQAAARHMEKNGESPVSEKQMTNPVTQDKISVGLEKKTF